MHLSCQPNAPVPWCDLNKRLNQQRQLFLASELFIQFHCAHGLCKCRLLHTSDEHPEWASVFLFKSITMESRIFFWKKCRISQFHFEFSPNYKTMIVMNGSQKKRNSHETKRNAYWNRNIPTLLIVEVFTLFIIRLILDCTSQPNIHSHRILMSSC